MEKDSHNELLKVGLEQKAMKMINFNFTVDDNDAALIFAIMDMTIESNIKCMKCCPDNEYDWYVAHIQHLKDLKSKMLNCQVISNK